MFTVLNGKTKRHENSCIQNGQKLSQLNVSRGTEFASISLKINQ